MTEGPLPTQPSRPGAALWGPCLGPVPWSPLSEGTSLWLLHVSLGHLRRCWWEVLHGLCFPIDKQLVELPPKCRGLLAGLYGRRSEAGSGGAWGLFAHPPPFVPEAPLLQSQFLVSTSNHQPRSHTLCFCCWLTEAIVDPRLKVIWDGGFIATILGTACRIFILPEYLFKQEFELYSLCKVFKMAVYWGSSDG